MRCPCPVARPGCCPRRCSLQALSLSLLTGALSLSLLARALSLSLLTGALSLSLLARALSLALLARPLTLALARALAGARGGWSGALALVAAAVVRGAGLVSWVAELALAFETIWVGV